MRLILWLRRVDQWHETCSVPERSASGEVQTSLNGEVKTS